MINEKKFTHLAVMVLLAASVFVAGCDRGRRGSQVQPDSSVTSLSGSMALVINDEYPYNMAFAKIVDNANRPITNLKVGNINILEDGRPVIPLDAAPAYSPQAIVLVLDRSGSMSGVTDDLNDAVIGFIDSLSERDYVEIIDFESEIVIKQTFTNDKKKLKDIIALGAALGGTMFYDAVGVAIDEVATISAKSIIIAMSDGYDGLSTKYPDVPSIVAYANSKNQKINTIAFGGSYGLDQIASGTGGTFIQANDADDLVAAYEQMVPEPVLDHIRVEFKSRDKAANVIEMYVMYGDVAAVITGSYFDPD